MLPGSLARCCPEYVGLILIEKSQRRKELSPLPLALHLHTGMCVKTLMAYDTDMRKISYFTADWVPSGRRELPSFRTRTGRKFSISKANWTGPNFDFELDDVAPLSPQSSRQKLRVQGVVRILWTWTCIRACIERDLEMCRLSRSVKLRQTPHQICRSVNFRLKTENFGMMSLRLSLLKKLDRDVSASTCWLVSRLPFDAGMRKFSQLYMCGEVNRLWGLGVPRLFIL